MKTKFLFKHFVNVAKNGILLSVDVHQHIRGGARSDPMSGPGDPMSVWWRVQQRLLTHKNVVNFHSTTMVLVVAIKPCIFLSRIVRSEIGITSFKSMSLCLRSTSLCTRDEIRMVNESKPSTSTSSTHAIIKWTHFTTVWKHEWIYSVIVHVQDVIWSIHFQFINRNMTIESGNPRGDHDGI